MRLNEQVDKLLGIDKDDETETAMEAALTITTSEMKDLVTKQSQQLQVQKRGQCLQYNTLLLVI